MKAKKVTIECEDNHGNIIKRYFRGWHEMTGKPEATIRADYYKKIRGELDITNRQVVGLDEVQAMPMGKKPKGIISQVEALRNSVLYRRLA